MASPTQWTWVWVNSGSWWWTGRPGVLRFMGSRRVGHDWATELNWTERNYSHSNLGFQFVFQSALVHVLRHYVDRLHATQQSPNKFDCLWYKNLELYNRIIAGGFWFEYFILLCFVLSHKKINKPRWKALICFFSSLFLFLFSISNLLEWSSFSCISYHNFKFQYKTVLISALYCAWVLKNWSFQTVVLQKTLFFFFLWEREGARCCVQLGQPPLLRFSPSVLESSCRKLLRVPWTARSKESILKEINPEYSLQGLLLKLKF